MYFPYNDSTTRAKDYCGHSHGFEGVLAALLDDPAGFTINGFEEYYSDQERKMLKAVQKKLNESNDSETDSLVARTDKVL